MLVSTLNPDDPANLAPMSSAMVAGHVVRPRLRGPVADPMNVERTGECVLNLPSPALAAAVDAIALYTGSEEVPPHKLARGYACEPHEFERAGVTPVASELASVPRVGRVGGRGDEHTGQVHDEVGGRLGEHVEVTARAQRHDRGVSDDAVRTVAVEARPRARLGRSGREHVGVTRAARLGLAAGACVEHAPPRDRYENRGR